MKITQQQWDQLTTQEKNKIMAELTPEDKIKIQDQWLQESEEEQLKIAEAQRFVAMDRIVKARPGVLYVPEEQSLFMVKKMAAFGLKNTQIAETIGISEKSLRNHFGEELRQGRLEVDYLIIDTLFRKAMDGDTACLIFWAKTRCRWSEPPAQHEHSLIKDGSDTDKMPNLTKMKEKEIAITKAVLNKGGSKYFREGP